MTILYMNLIKNKFNWTKYVYTLAIVTGCFSSVLFKAMFATSMVDFKYLFRTSLANITYANIVIGCGVTFGSLAGFLYKYVNKQLTFIIISLLMAISLAFMPIGKHFWILYICLLITSISDGAFDCGTYLWVIEMWKQNYSPVLHLCQVMSGLGYIIGPVITEPFLNGEIIFNSTDSDLNEEFNYSFERRNKLMTPFLIGGGIKLIVPIILTTMYLFERYSPGDTENLDSNDNSVDKLITYKTTRITLCILFALSLMCEIGMTRIYIVYSPTYYQIIPLKISVQQGARLLTFFSVALTIGQVLTVFISMKLRPEIMFCYHFVILITSIALLYFGQKSLTLIWIGNALLGLGLSALWTLNFCLAEKYVNLSDKIISLITSSAQLISIIITVILGPIFESKPYIMLYSVIICLICNIIIFISIICVIKFSKKV